MNFVRQTITLLFVLINFNAFSQSSCTTDDNHAMVAVWEQYKMALLTQNFELLNHLTYHTIYCVDCSDNTEQEKAFNDSLRTLDSDFWTNYLLNQYHVKKEKFIQEDINLIFNHPAFYNQSYDVIDDSHNVSSLIKKGKKNIFKRHQIFAILITISEPNEEYGGLQAIIDFIKTKNGYQLCGYGTIP